MKKLIVIMFFGVLAMAENPYLQQMQEQTRLMQQQVELLQNQASELRHQEIMNMPVPQVPVPQSWLLYQQNVRTLGGLQ